MISSKHNGFKRIYDSTTNELGIYSKGQKRLDFGNATLTQEGAVSAALLFGIGTNTTPVASGTASAKFLSFYFQNSATSGTSVGLYLRHKVTGVAGSGVGMRLYAETTIAAATIHALQVSVGTGESTTAGSFSGIGNAIYAQVGVANATVASGTLAAITAEMYCWGSSSSLSSTTPSFFRVSNAGTSDNTVDDNAFLFDLTGFTSGSAHMWYDNTAAWADECIRVKTPSGIRYLGLSNDTSFA